MADNQDMALLTPVTPSMPLCHQFQELVEILPITPPHSTDAFGELRKNTDSAAIQKALHVLSNERAALAHLEDLYTTSYEAQQCLSAAIRQIVAAQDRGGKVVFTGIGKSRLIALKLVATFVSLGIHSVFLHPTDALHGDLGVVRPNDIVLMITFSGKTPELSTLLPHIPVYVPLILLTSHLSPETCPLLAHESRRGAINILLPTPIHESERAMFGVSAPTLSTTVALALGDSLALSIADKMHCEPDRGPADIFASFHPGGAIGMANSLPKQLTPQMSDLGVEVADVPIVVPGDGVFVTVLDVLLAAVRAPQGWIRVSPTHIIGPRRSQDLTDPTLPVLNLEDGKGSIVVEKTDWISVLGSYTVAECRRWIIDMREQGDGRGKQFLKRGTLLGIVDKDNQISRVVEIEDVVGDDVLNSAKAD